MVGLHSVAPANFCINMGIRDALLLQPLLHCSQLPIPVAGIVLDAMPHVHCFQLDVKSSHNIHHQTCLLLSASASYVVPHRPNQCSVAD